MSVALAVELAGFGLVAGAASGLLGIGGGTLIVPFLVLVTGYSQHEAQATSLLVILPTAIVGSIFLRRRGIGDLPRSLAVGAVGAAAAFGGAKAALALPADTLRLVFAAFLAAIGLRMCVQALQSRGQS